MKIFTKIPKNFYSVRSGNDLIELKKWSLRAKKQYPKQKFKIINLMPERNKIKVNEVKSEWMEY